MTVALVEKDKVGGTCLHYGCIPTKALLHAAEVADNAREGAQFGVRATLEGIDMAGVNAYKDGVVDRLYKGLQGLVKAHEDRAASRARAAWSPRTPCRSATARCSGRNVVLASGSYARTLPGLTIEGRVITSDQALKLDWVPAARSSSSAAASSACEFASVWKSFGAEVTIVEALPRLVPLEDEAMLQAARAGLPPAQDQLRHRREVLRASTQDDSGVQVSLENGNDHRRRPAPGRRRPRPALGRPGLRGGRRHGRPRLGHHRRAPAAPASTASTPSATWSRACSWPTAASRRASSSPRRSPG